MIEAALAIAPDRIFRLFSISAAAAAARLQPGAYRWQGEAQAKGRLFLFSAPRPNFSLMKGGEA